MKFLAYAFSNPIDRHVIHIETLQALVDCNCLALFASKSISMPIEQFWIKHVQRTFYGQFLAHVILLVLFAFYNTIRQRNKANRLRQADDDDEDDDEDWGSEENMQNLQYFEYAMAALLLVYAMAIWAFELRQLRSVGRIRCECAINLVARARRFD